MNAHGEILIKPCPKTADGRNRLDFRIPDSDWFKLDLAQLLAGTHNEELCFSIVYLESVGDHPSSSVSCTRLDKFSERIMLRRCRQRLEGQIQRISYAYAWILGRWSLTPLKIQDTYIIIKICPRQLPCGTQQSMSKIWEEFWWMRTRWVCKERKDKIHSLRCQQPRSRSPRFLRHALLPWRAERRSISFKESLWKQFISGSGGMTYLNMNL